MLSVGSNPLGSTNRAFGEQSMWGETQCFRLAPSSNDAVAYKLARLTLRQTCDCSDEVGSEEGDPKAISQDAP